MPECDTRFPKTGLVSANTVIDRWVNATIARAKRGGTTGNALAKSVFELAGKSRSNHLRDKWLNVSGIEQWATLKLASDTRWKLKAKETKYHGVEYHVWENGNSGYSRVLSPTLKVTDKNGKPMKIGLDKLGHFMQQGYEYYEIDVLRKQTTEDAIEAGHQLEVGHYGLGHGAPYFLGTGVYSLGDLEANLQGLMFYDWLASGRAPARFRLKDYLNSKWNEEANINSYVGSVAETVWANLLTATWTGGFTIENEQGKPEVSATCTLKATGQKVKGVLKYKYKQGPVTIPFNGNISYVPWKKNTDLGYRGIILDVKWTSGDFTCQGRWRSGTTENTLTGKWGWDRDGTNGGTIELMRAEP